MITDPTFYFIAGLAVFIVGMGKGGFANGIGVIGVPLMALTIPPLQAAAILMPLLLCMDIFALRNFRGYWSKINLLIMLPGGLLGVVLGSLTFGYLSEDSVRILVAAIALSFSMHYWLRRRAKTQRNPSVIRGTLWATLSGFTSFGIHAGAPPIGVYLLPQQLDKKILMGTYTLFFATINTAKAIAYTSLGQLNFSNLKTSMMLLPVAYLGIQFGYFLLNKVDGKVIYQTFYISLAAIGVTQLIHIR